MAPQISLDGADALLIIADSERNADLFWATGFRAPDAFTYLATEAAAWVVVKDLELDRAREQVRDAEVLASSAYERGPDATPSPGGVLGDLLRERELQRLLVPTDFPLGIAEELRGAGFEVTVAPDPLFDQRAIKNSTEVAAIEAAQSGAEAAMDAAVSMLRQATVDGRRLRLDGATLTSETVRRRIHHALLDCDCAAQHTIVAGGEQGIDPHQAGHGPLPANAPILIDIFPCHMPTGYFGDITRTVVRGQPSDEVLSLYAAVAAAQQVALDSIRDGVDGADVHRAVVEHFESAGFESGERDGRMQGFFHGTGHGVGLEIHEAPTLSRRRSQLAEGHVVTVEPGLYYSGIGGMRIEDLVVVEADGYRNLTTFPKALVL